MPSYTIKTLEAVPTKPGCWNHSRIGVFDGDTQVGEYTYNYSGKAPFFPFEQNGKWYALYSTKYTASRVMSLPDCTDLGGEEPDSCGFCPVEFFVPQLTGMVYDPTDPEPVVANHDSAKWAHIVGRRYYWPDDPDHPQPDEEKKQAYLVEHARSHKEWGLWFERHPIVTRYAEWGFVYGCPWASPYWVRFIDLSKVADGILVIDDRIGAPDLPPGVDLEGAVSVGMNEYVNAPPDQMRFSLALPVKFDLTGKCLTHKG